MDKVLKDKLLDMLRYLDKTCEENQLRYYAIGGTFWGRYGIKVLFHGITI